MTHMTQMTNGAGEMWRAYHATDSLLGLAAHCLAWAAMTDEAATVASLAPVHDEAIPAALDAMRPLPGLLWARLRVSEGIRRAGRGDHAGICLLLDSVAESLLVVVRRLTDDGGAICRSGLLRAATQACDIIGRASALASDEARPHDTSDAMRAARVAMLPLWVTGPGSY